MSEYKKMHLETLFEEADGLINEKKYEDAYFLLKSIIDQEPNFGKAFNHLGWFYRWKVKDYAKAEEYYKKAMEVTPDYYASYTNYISLLSSQQRWKDMMGVIEKAMNVPSALKGDLYKDLGVMYEKQAKYEEAIEQYKKSAIEAVENSKFEEAKKSIDRCREKMKILQ